MFLRRGEYDAVCERELVKRTKPGRIACQVGIQGNYFSLLHVGCDDEGSLFSQLVQDVPEDFGEGDAGYQQFGDVFYWLGECPRMLIAGKIG